TARRYLDILTGSYVVRQLVPWFENIGKRQVKSPKVYVRDTGLLHALLGVKDAHGLAGHPKHGASFEGFAVEQITSLLGTTAAYFWGTHSGAELDLFVVHEGRRLGFEIKSSDAPTTTPSMRSAIETLRLDRLRVIYPGERSYDLDGRIRVVAMDDVVSELGGSDLG
ncbi:MAG: DUF4143 domain-containing protein, partial [Byssovorax sp.]